MSELTREVLARATRQAVRRHAGTCSCCPTLEVGSAEALAHEVAFALWPLVEAHVAERTADLQARLDEWARGYHAGLRDARAALRGDDG